MWTGNRLGLSGFLVGVFLAVQPAAASAQLEGRFTPVGPLPKENSLKVVVFEEFLNFSCPHCNNFRKAAKPLKEKFGKRLKVRYYPVLFRDQTDEVVRFFYLAEAAGRTEEIKDLIFDASFDNGVDVHDPAVVSYLARTSGLGEAYRKNKDAQWVDRLVDQARRRTSEAGVRATPTVVLGGALKVEPESEMDSYVKTLDSLIGQLLAK